MRYGVCPLEASGRMQPDIAAARLGVLPVSTGDSDGP
jgi:hypothetical protein